ncbi:MAG TPA: PaaI family thioesterase [Verrucomicrobiota bacterium]|nr:PaaI family thioesterase [Verrucomicrobiota bacterium]
MEQVKRLFAEDQFAKLAGIEIVEIQPGHAVCRMEIQPQHLNGLKTVHGGAIFTLADFAFAVASNSHGVPAMAINASISFLKAATAGVLRAEAKEVSLHAKLATYTVDITDATGARIALFQGTVYRKSDKSLVKG